MSCKCQGCGEQYKVDVMVSNELWKKIKPPKKSESGEFLCGKCILDRIEGFNKYFVFSLVREE